VRDPIDCAPPDLVTPHANVRRPAEQGRWLSAPGEIERSAIAADTISRRTERRRDRSQCAGPAFRHKQGRAAGRSLSSSYLRSPSERNGDHVLVPGEVGESPRLADDPPPRYRVGRRWGHVGPMRRSYRIADTCQKQGTRASAGATHIGAPLPSERRASPRASGAAPKAAQEQPLLHGRSRIRTWDLFLIRSPFPGHLRFSRRRQMRPDALTAPQNCGDGDMLRDTESAAVRTPGFRQPSLLTFKASRRAPASSAKIGGCQRPVHYSLPAELTGATGCGHRRASC
jgi:hypothetical protein